MGPGAFNQLDAGEFLVATAKGQDGVPYVYGAEEPGVAFDCSGLTQYSALEVGIVLPRTTFEQFRLYQLAKDVPSQPGDLIFIQGADGTPTEPGHVMIFVKNGLVIQAPFTGEDVGQYEVDTSTFMFRTRPALAHPLPQTVKKAGLVVLPDANAEALAIKNGWGIRYWNGKTFSLTPPTPLRTTFKYAVSQYATKR